MDRASGGKRERPTLPGSRQHPEAVFPTFFRDLLPRAGRWTNSIFLPAVCVAVSTVVFCRPPRFQITRGAGDEILSVVDTAGTSSYK